MDRAIIERMISLAIEIQQIPAPSLGEKHRAVFVRDLMKQERLSDVTLDPVNNVFARLPGESSARCLVVSAHLDTVFPAETPLSISRKRGQIAGPGIGDNSIGVAGLLGLVWLLEAAGEKLPGDLWLVANVGEEGMGNLKGMRAVVDRFADSPIAYVVLEGLAYGRIYYQGLGVRRYRIEAHTEGGHSWGDYGAPSAIHELASFVHKLTTRRLPVKPRTTINVGEFSGGISVNTIAADAALMLDLRSEGSGQLEAVSKKVEKLVSAFDREEVRFTCELVGEREAGKILPTHPLVSLAVKVLQDQGQKPELMIGSTDANVPLSRGYAAICIGLTKGGNAHTPREFMFTSLLPMGMKQLAEVVRGAFGVL